MPTNYETDAWKAYAARHYKWREVTVHHPDGSTEQGRILIPDYGIEFAPLKCAPTETMVYYEKGAYLGAQQSSTKTTWW